MLTKCVNGFKSVNLIFRSLAQAQNGLCDDNRCDDGGKMN